MTKTQISHPKPSLRTFDFILVVLFKLIESLGPNTGPLGAAKKVIGGSVLGIPARKISCNTNVLGAIETPYIQLLEAVGTHLSRQQTYSVLRFLFPTGPSHWGQVSYEPVANFWLLSYG